MRQAERRRLRNKPIRTRTRTAVKEARAAIVAGAENVAELVRTAISQLDRAVTKGVLHRNAAARRKSRLMRRYNALLRIQETAPATVEASPGPAKTSRKRR
jgi:small subunit ribosomal protein S20